MREEAGALRTWGPSARGAHDMVSREGLLRDDGSQAAEHVRARIDHDLLQGNPTS